MLKLLIADASEEFTAALGKQVAGSFTIRCAHQGKETLELIRTFRPDILVLDLMLPQLDGISILQQAEKFGELPLVLATTRILNDYIQTSMARACVGYLMVKPCDIYAVAARVTDLAGGISPAGPTAADERTVVSNVLRKLGVPAKLRGYAYLREAIMIAMNHRGLMITKEIYPMVGHICDARKEQVERSIRSAIAIAYDNRDPLVWEAFFSREGDLHRPSNGTFITALAEHLMEDR